MPSNPANVSRNLPARSDEPIRVVTEALERLRYGVIQLTVHEGKLMQVDVTERRRFN